MKPHLERALFGWASLDRTRFVWASNIMTHTHSHLYACMCQHHMSQHMTPHNHNCCVVLYTTESPGDESHDLCFSWKPAARSRGPRLSAWLVVRSPRPAHGAWNHIRPIVKPIVARHRLPCSLPRVTQSCLHLLLELSQESTQLPTSCI